MNRLKKGLTYISERGSFYRYSDKVQDEKWLQPLTEYVPLEPIMRGQPVSIATDTDIIAAAKRLATEYASNEDEINELTQEFESYLREDSHTFIVLTRPEYHKNAIGLSYEYTPGPTFDEDTESLVLSDKIHILDSGRFDIDPDYLLKSHQVETPEEILTSVINKEEYVPAFFSLPYKSIIGQPIYVKGNDAGKLTIVPEEAYLGYNNIIKIGFISDAWINGNSIAELTAILEKPEGERTDKEKELLGKLEKGSANAEEFIENSVSIQVQIQGDDRGALDSTLFEGILAEPVVISSDSPIRVFALGQEDDVAFSARINITPSTTQSINTKTAFIGFQKMDGKTEIVSFGDDFSITAAKDSGITEDASFLTIAQIYDPKFYETCVPHKAQYINNIGQFAISGTQESLISAIKEAWKALTGFDMEAEQLTTFAEDTSSGYIKITSKEPGGYYYMYISQDLHRIFLQDSFTYTNGSSNNKGRVVLADNRIPARQNIIGVYMSGIYDELLSTERPYIFMHDGLFRHNTDKYQEIGKEYFLGRHGFITRIPDTAYNTVVKVLDVQDEHKLLVHCDNMRVKTRGGDLPLGYTKPAIRVGTAHVAEYGFVLMDGTTPYACNAYPALYERLQSWFPKERLDYENPADPDNAYFIIPLCTTTTEQGGEDTVMQIKAIEYGLYEKEPRIPFIRKIGTFEPEAADVTITVGDRKYLKGNCVPLIGQYIKNVKNEDGEYVDVPVDTRFEITPICDLSIMENHIEEPSLENIDIRLFVDPTYDAAHSLQYHWVEIRSGFQNFNNNTTYGFEWKIDKEPATNDCPFGRYFLSTDIKDGMGLYYQTSTNNAPTRLSGCPWKLVVARRETIAQQYDLDGVMHAYLRNRTTDEEGNPYTTKAVTGAAVIDAIENRYHVRNLVAYPHKVDTQGNIESESHILLGKETEPATEVTLSAVNEIKIHSPNGIKFETSLKNGLYEEDHKIVIKDNWISVEKGTNDVNQPVDLPKFGQIKGNDFVTKDQVREHINKDATEGVFATREDTNKVVHGMIFGPRGNVNASLLSDMPIGRHHLQRVVTGGSTTPENDELNPSYLPYIYFGSDPLGTVKDKTQYITNTEGVTVHNKTNILEQVTGAVNGVYSSSKYSDTQYGDWLSFEEKINNNYRVFYNRVSGLQDSNTPKTLEIKYNFKTMDGDVPLSDFEFNKIVNNETVPATVKVAAINTASLAKYKRIYSEIKNPYNDTAEVRDTIATSTVSGSDAFNTYDPTSKEYLGSALQAAYEVPLAYWQYKTEPTWYKKYIGIVIDRVNDMRDNLNDSNTRTIFNNKDQHYWAGMGEDDYNDPKSTKPFNSDDNTYKYSDAELLSIKTYLNAITDNAESAQNINSTVGLLLKAAKETQERLLKVEASTFGADAPTIPGQTKNFVFPETPDVTPEATHLGLNRLIRAMAIELYGTANPDDKKLGDVIESNNTSTTLSRIDELETELEGKTFDTGVDTDAADNKLDISSATYPYAVNYETAHGGVTTPDEANKDIYIPIVIGEKLTYHSKLYNTDLEVKGSDILYYLNKNDINGTYVEYTGSRTDIQIPEDGDELYIKETFVDVLGNKDPLDGRSPKENESENSENHGTWTKIHYEKEANFEQKDGKFIADTPHNIVPEDVRDKFNGTIDAISRICTKVNALTYSINGKDNINATPERLNTIRNNIETLIKEAYFDGAPETTVTKATEDSPAVATTDVLDVSQAYVDEDLDHTDTDRTRFHQPSQPYADKKAHDGKGKDYTGLSRFDQLSKDLYDYVIDGFKDSKDTIYTNTNYNNNGGEGDGDYSHKSIQYTSADDVANKGASKKQVLVGRTFNGKQLLVDSADGSNGADVTSFNQTHSDTGLPKSFHINVPDSIEEYNYASIIDILIDALGTGYFRHQISEDVNTTKEELRPTETLTNRIENIEKALDNVAHKLSQKSFFELDTVKDHESQELFEDSESNKTYSIESFITHLNKWLGLSTLSNTQTNWDTSISAEVACGYVQNDATMHDHYFLVTGDEYVDNNDNTHKVEPNEEFYVMDATSKEYRKATNDDIAANNDLYVKRSVADNTDYLNTSAPIVNSNYVIKQLLKRLRKEESYYTILKSILGTDYDIEKAANSVQIVIDPKTGMQKIEGQSTYNLTDDIKDLLLTVYGVDERTSKNGVQTTYEHRSNIDTNDYITAHCWKREGAGTDESKATVYTSVSIGIGSTIWSTPAFNQYENPNSPDRIGTIAEIGENSITDNNGIVYLRYTDGDVTESNDSSNTRFTGNAQTRNIIDDIVKETYFVPDPIKFNSTKVPSENEGTHSSAYTENTTHPVDSKDVKYNENGTYYDFDSNKYHYDYEHDSDAAEGGATGKAIGYQNRDSLFRDYKGHDDQSEYKNYRRSRFEILEDEIRHLRSFLGLNEIIGNNNIGDERAAETAYGGKFYGTGDTSLAGHKFSGDATRNGNFFLKQNAAHADNNTKAESNLLTMVFNISNALRDISRELGTETDVRGVAYSNFSQLNKERENTIYERLAACEDLLGNLLGIANPNPNKEEDVEDDNADGTLNIQWVEE